VSVRAAKKANIPVVNVDQNTLDSPGDTVIATDSVASARTLGQYACKVMAGKGELAIIQGQLGTTPELDRDRGLNEALANCPEIKIVAKQPSQTWMQEEGFSIAMDMLVRHPYINAFFGRADALALGAARAVKLANVGRKVWIFGFDGEAAGLEAVRDGTLDATMTQKTEGMGKLALDSALDLIAGKQLPKEQLQEAVLTTKENVTPFIDQHP
jgi:ribose transport system substrate-binding protein